jgi:hypothetical protein
MGTRLPRVNIDWTDEIEVAAYRAAAPEAALSHRYVDDNCCWFCGDLLEDGECITLNCQSKDRIAMRRWRLWLEAHPQVFCPVGLMPPIEAP